MYKVMGDEHEALHPMFQEMLKRTDGWTDNVNESSLDYDFIKRHPHLSISFLTFTGIAVAAGNIGNVLVSVFLCFFVSFFVSLFLSFFLIDIPTTRCTQAGAKELKMYFV